MNSRKTKLLATTLLIATVAVQLGSFSASANNHKDTAWTARMDSNYQESTSDFSPYREKTDTSSSYMKYKSNKVEVTGWDGHIITQILTNSSRYTYKAIPQLVWTGSDEVYEDCGKTYTFSLGQSKYMINYIKERNCKYGAMRAFDAKPTDVLHYLEAGTLWSPDSV